MTLKMVEHTVICVGCGVTWQKSLNELQVDVIPYLKTRHLCVLLQHKYTIKNYHWLIVQWKLIT